MYKDGPLICLCIEFLGKVALPENTDILSPTHNFPLQEHHRLNRFISGIRIITNANQSATGPPQTPRVIKWLLTQHAKDLSFTLREGGTQCVAEYFQQTYNINLRYPDVLCVEVGSGVYIPMELCNVPPGQIRSCRSKFHQRRPRMCSNLPPRSQKRASTQSGMASEFSSMASPRTSAPSGFLLTLQHT